MIFPVNNIKQWWFSIVVSCKLNVYQRVVLQLHNPWQLAHGSWVFVGFILWLSSGFYGGSAHPGAFWVFINSHDFSLFNKELFRKQLLRWELPNHLLEIWPRVTFGQAPLERVSLSRRPARGAWPSTTTTIADWVAEPQNSWGCWPSHLPRFCSLIN